MEKTLKPQRAELEDWFLAEIAAQTERPMSEIDPELPFAALGLDSTAAIALTGEMEEKWGLEIDPTLVFEYPSIARLLDHLEAESVVIA